MKFYTISEYHIWVDKWMEDINRWIVWSVEENDPTLKALYKRTVARSMKQFHEELKSIDVRMTIPRERGTVENWIHERSMVDWVASLENN